MTTARILVVDDEIIIARELEARLVTLGYQVMGIASTGREAVDLTHRSNPDLVLMDIILKGDMDGIEAADEIRMRWGTPVIYVTAFADEPTLRRAKITEPFGYIVKPFSERELRANIEMALYKHQAEAKLMAIEQWFNASMSQIEDGVIATDTDGAITFINRVAELLTGWKGNEAIGRRVSETIPFLCRTCAPVPSTQELTSGGLIVEVSGDVLLRNNRGAGEIPIHLVVTPLRDGDGNAIGSIMVMRDVSEQKFTTTLLRRMEEQQAQSQKFEAASLMAGTIARRFNNLLSVILSQTFSILGQTLFKPENPRLSEDSRESLKRIKHSAESIVGLTDQLLTISARKPIARIPGTLFWASRHASSL
jgi:two-component system cell cycle sensor histidine kinase/response regulator CckA